MSDDEDTFYIGHPKGEIDVYHGSERSVFRLAQIDEIQNIHPLLRNYVLVLSQNGAFFFHLRRLYERKPNAPEFTEKFTGKSTEEFTEKFTERDVGDAICVSKHLFSQLIVSHQLLPNKRFFITVHPKVCLMWSIGESARPLTLCTLMDQEAEFRASVLIKSQLIVSTTNCLLNVYDLNSSPSNVKLIRSVPTSEPVLSMSLSPSGSTIAAVSSRHISFFSLPELSESTSPQSCAHASRPLWIDDNTFACAQPGGFAVFRDQEIADLVEDGKKSRRVLAYIRKHGVIVHSKTSKELSFFSLCVE